MSPKLRRLSGREVIAFLRKFRFSVLSQRGSHVKLRRLDSESHKQTLVVPLHDEIDRGTLQAIFRQASRFVPEEQLVEFFYSD